MKLLRYGPVGQEKPGLIDKKGYIRSLEGEIIDINGSILSPDRLKKLMALDPNALPFVKGEVRIGPCVGQVGKILCIGLNYSDHAVEMCLEIPKEPIVFSKFSSSICGPNDHIILPRHSQKTDWEVELAVIIGTAAKYVSVDNAMEHVAGYCIANDISERSFQLEGTGHWEKGKGCDTFGPIGPWLVTKDEIPDPQNLELWLEVDGHRYQQGNTKNMIFSIAYIVSYLSHFFTLYPGDIIFTGTPPGVGFGQKPQPCFLKSGQEMRLGITGLGEQRQMTIADKM